MSAPRLINPPPASGGVPVGGSGTPGTLPIWTASSTLGDSAIVQVAGAIVTVAITNAGAGGTAGNSKGLALTNITGTGTGATADIAIVGGVVTLIAIRLPGMGYTVGDTLSVVVGALAGAVFTVTAIAPSDNAAGNITAQRIASGSTSAPQGLSTSLGFTSSRSFWQVEISPNTGNATQARTCVAINSEDEPTGFFRIPVTESATSTGFRLTNRFDFRERLGNYTAGGIQSAPAIWYQNATGSSFLNGGNFQASAAGPNLSAASLNLIGVFSLAVVQSNVTNPNTISTLYAHDCIVNCAATGIQSIPNAGYIVPRAGFFANAAHVIQQWYGLWLPAPTLLNGSAITNNYGVYQNDPNATNFWLGKSNFVASSTSDTPGNAAAQILAVQRAGLSYLWMRQRATDNAISIDSYGSAWAEALRINADNTAGGANTVQLPTAGWGLKLPSTPGNSDSQALDAYREGTRVLAAGDLSGWTFNTATQYWTLVGRTVTLHTVFSGGTSSATGGSTIATPPLLTPLRIAAGSAVNSAGTALGNGVCVCGPTSGTTGVVQNSTAISSSATDKVLTVTYETAGL